MAITINLDGFTEKNVQFFSFVSPVCSRPFNRLWVFRFWISHSLTRSFVHVDLSTHRCSFCAMMPPPKRWSCWRHTWDDNQLNRTDIFKNKVHNVRSFIFNLQMRSFLKKTMLSSIKKIQSSCRELKTTPRHQTKCLEAVVVTRTTPCARYRSYTGACTIYRILCQRFLFRKC